MDEYGTQVWRGEESFTEYAFGWSLYFTVEFELFHDKQPQQLMINTTPISIEDLVARSRYPR